MIGLKKDPLLLCHPTSRYLITAPLSLHLDATETVLLQLFGFTEEVTVYVFLKTSMAPNHVVLARAVVTLNTQNHHQAAAEVRVRHTQSETAVTYYIYLYIYTQYILYRL